MTQPFTSGDRTYYVSDERLQAFRALTPEQRLRWVEELASFLRMAKISKRDKDAPTDGNITPIA
jgi:hypothetical protein